MLKILEGNVHIWFSLTKKINKTNLLNQYKDLLPEDELRQCDSFFHKTKSHQYLVSRALLRTTLSRYSSILPHSWKFSKNNNGKPFIDHNDEDLNANKLYFNLTHTDGLVLVGLTKSTDIGVDVEHISREFDYMDIAYSNFMPNEITILESMPGREQREFFYKYWTLKESYLKARGEGLSMALNLFSFAFDNYRKIECDFSDELKDHPSNWKFLQFGPAENYISSICLRRNNNHFPKINVRCCVPLIGDTELQNIDFLSS